MNADGGSAAMDDLLTEFVAETREMLGDMQGELIAWETDPSDQARLDTIFRFVHTVKGNCGFFHFPRLERLSHAAESALAEVRAHKRVADRALVDAILAVVDRIGALNDAIENNDDKDTGSYAERKDDELIDALDRTEATLPAGPPNPTNSANASGLSPAAPRSIRLPVELLDRVMNSVSDMVLARNDLGRRLRDGGATPELDGPFDRLTSILCDLRGDVTRMRMQRVEHLYAPLPRLVRDVADELGKDVAFVCEGGDVELDREMIAMIRDPVMHLVRNAVDHGIETADRRERGAKPARGTLRLTSRQSGNMIVMVLSDDGAGLDIAAIGQRAVDAGIMTRADAETRSRDELSSLIFLPGISTVRAISTVSGRGVGMDVVRSNIEKIGGTITVASEAGKGTQFTLRLPLTLSIVSALIVSIGEYRFAIPHSYLKEIAVARSSGVELARVGGRDLLSFRGQRIVCLALNRILKVDGRRPVRGQRFIVLRHGGGTLFALAVDRVHDQEDLVVKPLSPAIMGVGIYAGTTLMDDGRPVLMLDVPAIADEAGIVSELDPWAPAHDNAARLAVPRSLRRLLLFTDAARRRRAVDLTIVDRIDQVDIDACHPTNGQTRCMVEGRMLPLIGAMPDEPGLERFSALRLADGSRRAVLPATDLQEAEIEEHAVCAVDDDPELLGIVIIDGRPVSLLAGHALFANTGDGLRVPAVAEAGR